MPEESKHGVECSEFETLLSDALEGNLTPARKESFEAHRRVCSTCGPLFADVQAGQQWLRALEPVEPPVHLVHNILAATSGVVSTRPLTATAGGTTTPFGERLRERWGLLLHAAGSLCAAAALCDVVRDDLLLVLTGFKRIRRQAVGRGEG